MQIPVCLPLVLSAVIVLGASIPNHSPAHVRLLAHESVQHYDTVALQWNSALLEAVRRTAFRPMWTARALAIVHTAMFDAWAAYDRTAIGVHWAQNMRRPAAEAMPANVQAAVSVAAYRTLVDLFPTQAVTLFDPLMEDLGVDPLDSSLDLSRPIGIGNRAAASVIAFRHADGANQLGNPPYSDYTGYTPVNSPEQLNDPNRWQPLRGADSVAQTFLAPHWGLVTPFALTSADQFRPPSPAQFPENEFSREAEAVRQLSAQLTDRDKVIAEYWADGPATETPAGHWALFAQFVSRRDSHSLDDDVQMFFALGNALLDASIAVWDCKRMYDYPRPITAIRHLYAGTLIEAWGGPFQGTQLIRGEDFRSYIATPPFPEYTSGHSAFSAAGAEILKSFTGNPHFGAAVIVGAGTSSIEPGAVPRSDVMLSWRTFDDAAEEAGLSRRLGGIHFRQGDLESRDMGKRIGRESWAKAQRYFSGDVQ